MTPDVACIGHLNVEDTTIPGQPLRPRQPGGAALYSAIGAWLWGSEVSVVSVIGEDYPVPFLERLQHLGIDTRHIREVPEATMSGLTSYRPDGSRTYEMYVGRDARQRLTPAPDTEHLEAEAAHLCPMPAATQLRWAKALRKTTTSLDTDPGVVAAEPEEARRALESVTAFLPSEAEVEALELSTPQGYRFLSWGPEVVVVKRGEAGVTLFSGNGRILELPAYRTEVVDPTGAGDAFCGGFIAEYARSRDAPEACLKGIVSASMVIEGYGALHLAEKDRRRAVLRLASLRRAVAERQEEGAGWATG